MQRRLFFWEAGGFLFVGALGVLLHFVYEWSGDSPWAAAFSAVNESTWEHIKLLYLPLFLFSVVEVSLLGRNYPHLPAVRALSALTGLALIPVLFYTYTGVLGRDFVWADVAIFFLADLGAFALDFALLRRMAAGAGTGGAVGPGFLLRLVHLPPGPAAPVAGPGDGAIRHLLKRPKGRFRFFGIYCEFAPPRLDQWPFGGV